MYMEKDSKAVDLQVREFSWKDIEKIFQIAVSAFEEDYKVVGSDKEDFKRAFTPYRIGKWIQKIARNEYFKFYVGEINENVVAAVLMDRRGDYWYISTVMVDERSRGKGYGREILTIACRDTCTGDTDNLVLHVPESSPAAKNLYQSVGFKSFETVIQYWRKCEHFKQGFPPGYHLTSVAVYCEQALSIIDRCRHPSSSAVYGTSQLPPWYCRVLERIFQTGTNEQYALTYGDQWVGIVRVYAPHEKEGAAVIPFDVLPEYRGNGLEEALLKWGLTKGFTLGVPRLVVQVNQEYTQLVEACETLDFATLEVLEGMVKQC